MEYLFLLDSPKSHMFIFPGDGYNISQIGSSVSYPNSPTAEYYAQEGAVMESEMRPEHQGFEPRTQMSHSHSHHHHFNRPANGPQVSVLGPAATLGRHSGRFGNGKSPFRVVVPSNGSGATPPVCSTPQNSLPILEGLEGRERVLPEFSTFGAAPNGYNIPKQQPRSEPIEPNGHLV